MRQGQQNRRGRGRNNNNNNNRKSQNPLTRSFESAGPDVKLRGTPSHIAEKYVSLARDALSSGDPVLAENYLQHAEHYNRIILSFREQQMSQGGMDPFNNGQARTHSLASPDGSDAEDFADEDGGEDFAQQPQPATAEGQAQPFTQPPRQYDNQQQRYDNRQRGDNRGGERHNNQRFDRNDRQDFRGPRGDRGDRADRGDRGDNRGYREDRRPQTQSGDQGGDFNGNGNGGGGGYRRRDRFQGGQPSVESDNGLPPPAAPSERAPVVQAAAPPPEQEQPAFLRRPVRRPRRDDAEAAAPARSPATAREGDDQE